MNIWKIRKILAVAKYVTLGAAILVFLIVDNQDVFMDVFMGLLGASAVIFAAQIGMDTYIKQSRQKKGIDFG